MRSRIVALQDAAEEDGLRSQDEIFVRWRCEETFKTRKFWVKIGFPLCLSTPYHEARPHEARPRGPTARARRTGTDRLPNHYPTMFAFDATRVR